MEGNPRRRVATSEPQGQVSNLPLLSYVHGCVGHRILSDGFRRRDLLLSVGAGRTTLRRADRNVRLPAQRTALQAGPTLKQSFSGCWHMCGGRISRLAINRHANSSAAEESPAHAVVRVKEIFAYQFGQQTAINAIKARRVEARVSGFDPSFYGCLFRCVSRFGAGFLLISARLTRKRERSAADSTDDVSTSCTRPRVMVVPLPELPGPVDTRTPHRIQRDPVSDHLGARPQQREMPAYR